MPRVQFFKFTLSLTQKLPIAVLTLNEDLDRMLPRENINKHLSQV
jgi:hypothetical protein